ncbi:MAG: cytochrome b5 [Nitrospirae bacterium]|nr:cytochrome b5 [Nitrospirota bacterium]
MNNFLLNCFQFFFLVSVVLIPLQSSATTEYARQTGFECKECHIQAIGGGPLTKAGEQFVADMKIQGLYRPLTTMQKIIRFLIGYIHLLTAVAWFGTILYVHILLKPAYAAKGLPRGELILGWMSIIIMSVTGTLLTIARIPSWNVFYTTRFGILLSIKIILFLIMASTAVIVTFFIGPKLRKKLKEQRDKHTGADNKDFSIEALDAFDGKEGRPAYIAYKGAVYDVTPSKLWKDGSHLRKHSAGNDLTEILKTAPHGEEKILSMKKVGELKSADEATLRPFHERVFYFFAYMNLVFVFLIIFVIALMRWG